MTLPTSVSRPTLLSSVASEGEAPRFAAFAHRNFRLFWIGNLVSLIGTLAQMTALGWLVRMLTDDPRAVTAVTACTTGPNLFLALYAGVLADRVDKRRALIWLNAAGAALAVLLAFLAWMNWIQVWQVLLLAFVAGVINAFDIPVRQSFNYEMVGKRDLPNAIALNSTAFNLARVAGPAAGGLLLYQLGAAGCFLVNAISFGALILGLSLMRLEPHQAVVRPFNMRDFWRGVLFVRRNRVLRLLIVLVSVVSVLALSYGSLLPIFAKDVFRTGELGYSMLLVCNGLGAFIAAITTAAARDMKHKGKRLLLGAFLTCLSIVGFASSPQLWMACLFLIVAGWALLMFLMTANIFAQTLPPDYLRGRVFSIYALSLVGMMPVGAILIGALAKVWGARLSVQLCSLAAAFFTFYIFIRFPQLWKER